MVMCRNYHQGCHEYGFEGWGGVEEQSNKQRKGFISVFTCVLLLVCLRFLLARFCLLSGLFQKFGRFSHISLFLCPHIEMNFWKPGEEYPDGMDEEKVELDKEAPVDRMAREITKSKVQLSDRMKNMSVRGCEGD